MSTIKPMVGRVAAAFVATDRTENHSADLDGEQAIRSPFAPLSDAAETLTQLIHHIASVAIVHPSRADDARTSSTGIFAARRWYSASQSAHSRIGASQTQRQHQMQYQGASPSRRGAGLSRPLPSFAAYFVFGA